MRAWVAVGLLAVVGCETIRNPPPGEPPAGADDDPLAQTAECLGRNDHAAAADHLAERAAMMQSWADWLDSIAAAHQA